MFSPGYIRIHQDLWHRLNFKVPAPKPQALNVVGLWQDVSCFQSWPGTFTNVDSPFYNFLQWNFPNFGCLFLGGGVVRMTLNPGRESFSRVCICTEASQAAAEPKTLNPNPKPYQAEPSRRQQESQLYLRAANARLQYIMGRTGVGLQALLHQPDVPTRE